jgi:hypothetical protein
MNREQISDTDRAAVAAVMVELSLARAAHPPVHSLHEGYAVILEEVEELWEEVRKKRTEEAYQEAAQVAVTAIGLMGDILSGAVRNVR